MPLKTRLKDWAGRLKRELAALYLAGRDPRTPWHARLVVIMVVGYALSPIDLIPDFIPVLGYLDDLLLVPAGLALALKLVPAEVMADCRLKAADLKPQKSRTAAVIVILIWTLIFAALALKFVNH